MQIALELTPSVQSDGFGTTLAAAWIASVIATALAWITSAGTDTAFDASLRRRRRGQVTTLDDAEIDGVVFVQVDGLPFPVLQWASGGRERLHTATLGAGRRLPTGRVDAPDAVHDSG